MLWNSKQPFVTKVPEPPGKKHVHFRKPSQTRPLSVRLALYNTAINRKQPHRRNSHRGKCNAQKGMGHEKHEQEDSRQHPRRSDASRLRHCGICRLSLGQPFLFCDGGEHADGRHDGNLCRQDERPLLRRSHRRYRLLRKPLLEARPQADRRPRRCDLSYCQGRTDNYCHRRRRLRPLRDRRKLHREGRSRQGSEDPARSQRRDDHQRRFPGGLRRLRR